MSGKLVVLASRRPFPWLKRWKLLHSRLISCRDISSSAVRAREGPGLSHFMPTAPKQASTEEPFSVAPYLKQNELSGNGRKVYIEIYGCQMNVNDADIAWTFLSQAGYHRTDNIAEADVILAVTCSIRDNAERKIWSRLDFFRSLKRKRSRSRPPLKIGLLGCMAERLKKKILETDKMVDLVAGPDSYRSLPQMLAETETGQSAVNVLLSLDETYADVMPVRINSDSPTAYISIMRGCENMCSFCIVPFTRGRERSRPINSIIQEVKMLSDQGVKEVTLLGQNVNSYRDLSQTSVPLSFSTDTHLSKGFSTIYRSRQGGRRFADLLDKVSMVDPEMRIRFTSPHPKDFPDELLYLIRERANMCKLVHMPAQSGNTEVLKRMRRGYSRESYLELVENIRSILPEVSLSSDFMAGFCGETEEEHRDTISLLETVKFDMAYMFSYSMRKKTHAYHTMEDDVPEDVKKRRLQEIIDTFYSHVGERNRRLVGTHQLVLVEGTSKRSEEELAGRTDGNVKVIFPQSVVDPLTQTTTTFKAGDYVIVKITEARDGSVRVRGVPLCLSSILHFSQYQVPDSDQPSSHSCVTIGYATIKYLATDAGKTD